jgi:mono/diheme cytochrome c family protein
MTREEPATYVQEWLHRSWRWQAPLYVLAAVVVLLGIVGLIFALIMLWQILQNRTPHYADISDHFKYGSIGAEPNSGIPYRIWRALPTLFPESFQNRDDYSAFGFLYENDAQGRRLDLPIGIARREHRGVEIVWFNCATCHTGTVTATLRDENGRERTGRHVVLGMPSNNLALQDFIRFLLEAGADERMSPDRLIAAINATGDRLGWLQEAIYRYYVIPVLREGLIARRTRLLPLFARQPAWGPGRVDTFNPYKLIQANMPFAALEANEIIGVAEFPAIFEQGPREGMHLHWDGNNTSLAERNLSAALGAGVTAESADHAAIERVAEWLRDFRPPASPYRPDPAAVARGQQSYMRLCSACHGYQAAQGFLFQGARLGQVEPIATLGTDRHRLDSYTERFRSYQLANFFRGTPYQFRAFIKTDGYANLPLDGLWLRAPYLHNGAVPTLADLLEPPERRPQTFLRRGDLLDSERGGFVAPPCDPGASVTGSFCFDTRLPGNGNGGHVYGTDLSIQEKSDLLAYLLTF